MISLRYATAKDAEILARWFNDRKNTEYMEDTMESYDPVCIKDRIEPLDFMIMLDEKPIGFCSIYNTKERAEISILIGEKGEQGKGYGKKALQLLCELALERFEELYAYVDESNLPSLKIFEACGFRIAGRRGRDFCLVKKRS